MEPPEIKPLIIVKENKFKLFWNKLKSNKKYLTFLFVLALLPASVGVMRYTTSFKNKAAETTTGVNYNEKFKEDVVFDLKSPSQIYGYFQNDHRQSTASQILPSGLRLENGVATLTSKGGIIINNPLKDESFYRVEVELEDANQQNLTSFITMLDELWSVGDPIKIGGVSVGIDAAKMFGDSKVVYWYNHSQLKLRGEISDAQYNYSLKAENKFVVRKQGTTKITIYVTPNGTYPVVNGTNFASFPRNYRGSYIYRPNPDKKFKYIVLNKMDTGGESVTFKNLKITKLDSDINTVEDVSAFFFKKNVEKYINSPIPSFALTECDGPSTVNTSDQALRIALNIRMYDYYFNQDHRKLVQDYYDIFLKGMENYYCVCMPKLYGKGTTHWANHDIVNRTQHYPVYTFGLSGYLREDQLLRARKSFAKIVDVSMNYIDTYKRADPIGEFPWSGDQYNGDTYAEEISWLISLYSGYYSLYPNDGLRSEYILYYLKFFGVHHLSDGKTAREIYGDNYFTDATGKKILPDRFLDFRTKYIWDNYLIDNHYFHPSIQYSFGIIGGAVMPVNMLAKRGVDASYLKRNVDQAYQANIIGYLDPSNFNSKKVQERNGTTTEEDVYDYSQEGFINLFTGHSVPSGLEDWAITYTSYSVPEYYGDYNLSNIFAKNVYYSFYNVSGKLFSDGISTFGAERSANFAGGDAAYASMNSLRSSFYQSNFYQTVTIPNSDDMPFSRPEGLDNVPWTPKVSVVPSYCPAPLSGGLNAQYFGNKNLTAPAVVSKVDPQVFFDWGTGSPASGVGVDNFSVRWMGQITPKYSQNYIFYTTSDDGVRLAVNGKWIINNWTDHPPTENVGNITLTAGQKYNVVMDYYENGGGAIAKLYWSSPSQAKEIIPQTQFTPLNVAIPPAPTQTPTPINCLSKGTRCDKTSNCCNGCAALQGRCR
jgi:hypothetical protein